MDLRNQLLSAASTALGFAADVADSISEIRKYVGIDLNPTYHDLAVKRFAQGVLDLGIEAAA